MQLPVTVCVSASVWISECLQDVMRERAGKDWEIEKGGFQAILSALLQRKWSMIVPFCFDAVPYFFWSLTQPGVSCDLISKHSAPLGWVNSRMSLADLLHWIEGDCDKRHICGVQALRSALLVVKSDLTLCNPQAPRADSSLTADERGYKKTQGLRFEPVLSFEINSNLNIQSYLRVKSVLENLAEGLCIVLWFPRLGGEQYSGLDPLRHGLTHQLSRELHSPTQNTQVRTLRCVWEGL